MEDEDERAGDKLGAGLIGGALAFVVVYHLTQRTFFAMGTAVVACLLASGRMSALIRQIDAHLNHRGVLEPETRGLEDVFVATQHDAERYWSSYDPSQIWQQRAEEIETSGQQVTLYAHMRTSIPELAGASYRPEITTALQRELNEPLGNFWARYHEADVIRLDFTKANDVASLPDRSLGSPPKLKPDYSNLAPHLALIAETKDIRQAFALAAKQGKGEFGSGLVKMAANVEIIIAAIVANPEKLGEVQRLFTYYLPEVGKLLDARRQMAAINEVARMGEIDAILDRIEAAFAQFGARMHEADIRALDIDLRLLDQSLAAEFES